ncbi:hypothetical protein Q7C36_014424 [Tachysurus vachellii]|uniref:Uncharacterized protein n=1 Tax=Tachysurus vachellii TaxID=175792 RepID=A0AA88MF66_TACVA|nr:hypothetical protein Q7C36_014424 [Tachysurus vachellii]
MLVGLDAFQAGDHWSVMEHRETRNACALAERILVAHLYLYLYLCIAGSIHVRSVAEVSRKRAQGRIRYIKHVGKPDSCSQFGGRGTTLPEQDSTEGPSET